MHIFNYISQIFRSCLRRMGNPLSINGIEGRGIFSRQLGGFAAPETRSRKTNQKEKREEIRIFAQDRTRTYTPHGTRT